MLFAPNLPGLTWNSKAGRYVGANGRFLSQVQIRGIIDRNVAHISAQMEVQFERLQRQEITLAQWRDLQAKLIKDLHIANYASAKGGFHKLTNADLGRIGAEVKRQYHFLNRFTSHLAQRPGYIETDGAASRAASYAQAGRITYEAVRLRASLGGYRWARRIPHSRESCKGCANCVDLGWMPVEEMTPVGGFECNIWDHCTIIFSNSEEMPGLEDYEGEDELG